MLGKNEIREILKSRFANDRHTKISEIPLPCDLKDTYKAALRIKTAIEENQRIAVVGDYDVDGIVSTVIMSDFFNQIGAEYVIKIPNRFTDGYGLNSEIIGELEDVDLIITVDNGTSATEAAEICAQKGIDLIITDHHMPPPVLPRAYAIINPKQPDCTFPNIEICGAQVAWYLVGALKETLGVNYDMASSMDILIIAIIADMMELRDMNRALLRFGIKRLNSSNRACFKAIKEHYFKKHFEFDDISYTIAPLINCTGRMDDATMSYKFLCAKNIREANHYLETINSINNSRKEEEKNLYDEIVKSVDPSDNVIVVWGPQWHEGIIGIIAARLKSRFARPALVATDSGENGWIKASLRSVSAVPLHELLHTAARHLPTDTLRYGGHAAAAGLSVKREHYPALIDAINRAFLDTYGATIPPEPVYIDGELPAALLNLDWARYLEQLEPWGAALPVPVFANPFEVLDCRLLGSAHTRLVLREMHSGNAYNASWFFHTADYRPGTRLRIAYELQVNRFYGDERLSLLVQHAQPL